MDNQVPDPQIRLMQLLAGHWISQAVTTAAKLGISDALTPKPLTLDELASQISCNPSMLQRLMAILVAEELYNYEPCSETYCNSETGQLLTQQNGLKYLAEFVGSAPQSAPWTTLYQSIQKGTSAFEESHGQPLYSWLDAHPHHAKLYDAAISQFTSNPALALAETYDFSSSAHVVDVGGGLGLTLATLLSRWPHLRGTLIDRPQVLEQAQALFHKRSLEDRCAFSSINFLEEPPPQADVYLVKHVLHNWGHDQAVRLLKNCRAAGGAKSHLLVIEGILPPGTTKHMSRLMDLQMMMLFGQGKTRTKKEFKQLFLNGGWRMQHKTQALDSFARLLIGVPGDIPRPSVRQV